MNENEGLRSPDTLPSRNESNFLEDIIRKFKLIISFESNLPFEEYNHLRKLLSLCDSIFSSKAVGEAFFYFLKHGAATSWILQVRLDMPEATVHRVLKRLRRLGVVTPVLRIPKIKKTRKGGPRPKIWGLLGCTDEQVASCIVLHTRCLSPKYRVAEKVAQDILDNYLSKWQKEITYREIFDYIKKAKTHFMVSDVADLAAQYIQEKGVKVWR